jgi:hypothetical protein
MKSSIKFIIGTLLFVIGLVTWLFFRRYNGEVIPVPIVWYFTGIACMLFGLLQIRKGYSQLNKQVIIDLQAEVNNFKLTADKILVDLNSCEIKANNYTEQVVDQRSYRSQAFDTMRGSPKKYGDIYINQAMLIFETEKYGQKERYYSPTIYKDEITLRFLLDKQKETYLYIDKNNREKYYFDLEFLEN